MMNNIFDLARNIEAYIQQERIGLTLQADDLVKEMTELYVSN